MKLVGTLVGYYRIARSYNFAVVHYILANEVLHSPAVDTQDILAIDYNKCQSMIHTMYLVVRYLFPLK